MNIPAITTFVTVSRLGALNRAAEALNVTQSTVTARLDALEQALGARLLVRSRRGASLTKAGFRFLGEATLIVETWRRAQKQASLSAPLAGLFSLGCEPALWRGAGDEWLDTVRKAHPGLACEAWPGEAEALSRWLESGLVDAALSTAPVAGGFASRVMLEETVAQYATVKRQAKRWDDGYIYVEHGPAFRRWHARTWSADETPALTFGHAEWALDHLLRAGGSAYLPARLAEPHVTGGRLHRIDDAPAWHRRLVLSWHAQGVENFPWLTTLAHPGSAMRERDGRGGRKSRRPRSVDQSTSSEK